jgi:hypothetical protein
MADYKTTSDKPKTTTGFRDVWYVQIHDAFSPLQMAPLSSLSMIGHNPCIEMVERPNGIFVRTMGKMKDQKDLVERQFTIPYGNISHYEYVTEWTPSK